MTKTKMLIRDSVRVWTAATLLNVALATTARSASTPRGWQARSTFVLGPLPSPTLLPAALHSQQPALFLSSSAARKALRRGLVLVGGERATVVQLVGGGEAVCVLERAGVDTDAAPDAASTDCAPASARRDHSSDPRWRLEVVYEDDELAVVVKPHGMPTQGSPGLGGNPCAPSAHTLLARALAPSRAAGRLHRPLHCHRLDEPTGGLLVVAKTQHALIALSAAFRERAVRKTYEALACADAWRAPARPLPDSGACDAPLGGKPSATEFRVLARYAAAGCEFARVELTPRTGRNHQLRRHLAQLGWPIVGESRSYASAGFRRALGRGVGKGGAIAVSCLFLWAARVEFDHPSSGERVAFAREPPRHFDEWPRHLSLHPGPPILGTGSEVWIQE